MQQIYNVAGLFEVFHVGKHFVLLLVGHASHEVGSVVRIHVVDETAGDGFCRERFDETYPFLFVDFR